MLRTIYRASVALLLPALLLCSPQLVGAQVAPTNSATIIGNVSDSNGEPIANAKVSLTGARVTSTRTDGRGQFAFVGIPLGNYLVIVEVPKLGTATRSILVDGDINVAIQYGRSSSSGLKEIAQVSSASNANFNVTPASITQVNAIANALQGKTSWRTILEQIPGVVQGGLYSGYAAALPDGPLVPMQISINGTLPYETATLLDNMPLIGTSLVNAPGAGTNIASYPLNGFAAADVIRGPGASAPTIVDSIGGSLVLHPSGVVNSDHFDLSASTDPYGGIIGNALDAVRWNKLSATVTYGVNDSPGPISGSGLTPNYGFDGSPTAINGQSFSPYVLTPLYDPQYSPAASSPYGYKGALLMCCANYTTAWTQHSGSLALQYAISPSVSASIFYAGESSAMAQPQPAEVYDFQPPAGYTGHTGQLLNYGGAYFGPGGTSVEQNVANLLEEKITAQVGKGMLQLAALQNRSSSDYAGSYPDTAAVQLYGAGYLGGKLTYFNGATYTTSYTPGTEYESEWSDNRDLLLSYVTPIGENVHIGASSVRSYYNNPSVLSYSYGAPFNFQAGSVTPSAISQTTNETRVFVGGNPSELTSLDLSMYFARADYHVLNPNDPASSTYTDSHYSYATPRLGFVWHPTGALAVRAAAGGGFAEAPLSYLVGSNGAIAPSVPSGSYSVTKVNLNLQPERSFSFDTGADLKIYRNTLVSLDVYRTNLYGQFYNSTSVTGTYLGLPLYTTQYGNLGESRYEGVLLDLRHAPPHGIYYSIAGGMTRGYVVSVPSGFYNTATCTACENLNVVPGVNFNGTFTGGASIPYTQGSGQLGYRWAPDKYADTTWTYYGNNNSYYRPAFVELDGHISYPLTRIASLLLTFRNITGIYDGAYQILTPGNLSGAPAIRGLPYPLYGEEYGPRTVMLTTNLRL